MHLFLEVNLRFSDYCKTTGLFQDPLAIQPLDIGVAMHCSSHISRVSFMCPTCALRYRLPDWLDDRFAAGEFEPCPGCWTFLAAAPAEY